MDAEEQNKNTRNFLRQQALEAVLSQAPIPIQEILDKAQAIKRWAEDTLDEGIRAGIKMRELER